MSIAALQAAYNAGLGDYVGPRTSLVTIGGIKCVAEDPEWLASSAGLSLDVYALARVLVSEGYGGGDAVKKTGHAAASVAIGQCIVNLARKAGWGIFRRITESTVREASGRFGEQHSRRVASRQDPREWHVAVADAVLGGGLSDLVKGATSFDDPAAQAGGTQSGRTISSPEILFRRWADEDKLMWIGEIPTVDSWYLAFFRKEKDAEAREEALTAILEVVDRGRNGDHYAAAGDPDSNAKIWLALAAVGAIGLIL